MPGDKHPLVRGKVSRFFANRFLATLIVVILAGALAFTGASGQIWPVFGASNQLLAALTLLVITLILIKKKSKFLVTMIPMIFMMVVCLWALVSLLITNLIAGNKVLVIATAFLVVMAVILMVQSATSVIKARTKKPKEN